MKRFSFLGIMLLSGTMMAQTAPLGKSRLPYELSQQQKLQMSRPIPDILYHGGPVMSASTHVYVVYYGTFTPKQHNILDTFIENLGGSPAFNVNTEYYDAKNEYVQNVLNYNPATDAYDDPYSLGKTLKGNFDTTILHNDIAAGYLPVDLNGIYVLTISPDVELPNSVWCAYHSNSGAIVTGDDIKYAVAPDPPKSILTSCSGNLSVYHDGASPNGDVGMDEVVDSLIHEFSETVTDPNGTAWFTQAGLEVGDICNFIYGTTFLAANGSHANHTFGSRNYLAQEIWSMEDPLACVQGH
jgi:hypothetical protein